MGETPADTMQPEKQLPVKTESQADTEIQKVGTNEPQYLGPKRLVICMFACYLGMFVVALDRTIIATAIPWITDDFNSIQDIGWYGSAYLLTACCFQLLFGRLVSIYPVKLVFLSSLGIFEIGSVVCGAAPTSTAFIIGRAIAGIGTGGVFAGLIAIILVVMPLEKRPVWQAGFGMLMGVSAITAPLIGGAFTQHVSWRWCFYINLPVGAVAIAIIIPFLTIPHQNNSKGIVDTLKRLDPLGNLCFLPSMICLLLALQWGGSTYSWSDGRIIALLTVFSVLFVAWIAVEGLTPDTALVPKRIALQRTTAAATITSVLIGASFLSLVYYLPIWFQAIKGASPVKSGLMLIPMIVPMVIGTIFAGKMVGKFGYYSPFLVAGSALMSIGSGLMTTWTAETGHPKWIGYQVIFGLGLGLMMQQPNIAVQTVLPRKDVNMGVSLCLLGLNLGGAIFVSVCQNTFASHLIDNLSGVAGLDAATIVNTGATNLRKVVQPQDLPQVLTAYNNALVVVFRISLIVSTLTFLGSLGIEWRSIKTTEMEKENRPDKEQKEEGGGGGIVDGASTSTPGPDSAATTDKDHVDNDDEGDSDSIRKSLEKGHIQ